MTKITKNTKLDISLTKEEIVHYLKTKNSKEIQALFLFADRVREEYVGNAIHIRGLLNISNHCKKNCKYCGLRFENYDLKRYRMPENEILETVDKAVNTGYRTIVFQSGEDEYYFNETRVANLIHKIKRRHDIAITLSLGERNRSCLQRWFDAGADRYLLKHETSDPELYEVLHENMTLDDRLEMLEILKEIGYQTGSGIMVGLPGQTYETVADDIILFRNMDIDMIGCGPYIFNPDAGLYRQTPEEDIYIQPTELNALRVLALTRIVNKDSMLPSTTALETISTSEIYHNALNAGANVVMFDITPAQYKEDYRIYPKEMQVDGIKDFNILCDDLIKNSERYISRDRGDR